MYFAFLSVYTKALIWPTALGILTMLGHLYKGVEGNPLTIAYSIAIALWSCIFLNQWERKQCELQFLWGVETFEVICPPHRALSRAVQTRAGSGIFVRWWWGGRAVSPLMLGTRQANEAARKEFVLNPKTVLKPHPITKEPEFNFSIKDKLMRGGTSLMILGVFIMATLLACCLAMWLKLFDDILFGWHMPKGGMNIFGLLPAPQFLLRWSAEYLCVLSARELCDRFIGQCVLHPSFFSSL